MAQCVRAGPIGGRSRWFRGGVVGRCRSPVLFWAGLGVVFLTVEVWVLTRWVVAGGLHSVAARGDLTRAQVVAHWVVQIGVVLGLLVSAWYAVRSSRNQGRVDAFAALFAGGLTAFWLDPLYNFQGHVRSLSTQALNVSTWGPFIPGWHGPFPDRQVETVVMASGLVYGLPILWIMMTLVVIKYTARRRPRWGPVRLAIIGALAGTVLDIVVEMAFLPSGAYSWGISPTAAIFAGHWYQVPVFDNIVWGVVVCMPPAMMCHLAFRKGADVHFLRGSDRVVPRLLAGVGLAQLTLLVNIVAIALIASLVAGPQPSDTPGVLRLSSGATPASELSRHQELRS